jgi:hypothetical protein
MDTTAIVRMKSSLQREKESRETKLGHLGIVPTGIQFSIIALHQRKREIATSAALDRLVDPNHREWLK